MRKLRNDSKWNRLTPQQRALAEQWLFSESRGYGETASRLKSEFGLETSIASVGRYYRRRARERQLSGQARARQALLRLVEELFLPERAGSPPPLPVKPNPSKSNQSPQNPAN